jgi:hypothetical protein
MDPIEADTGNVLQPKTIIYSNIKTLPATLSERVLHQKYVVERRSMRQIAAEFSSSKTAIRNGLLRFKIPLRGRWRNPHRVHNLPFGKKCIRGRVVAHEGEQKIISSILEMKNQGFSNVAIARALSAMKTPTKKRGKRWHYEMVRQILLRTKSQT